MRVLPEYSVVDHHDDAPIVLAGGPRRLKGTVRLHNPGEARVVVRDARLCGLPAARTRSAATGDKETDAPSIAPDLAVSIPAILAPGQHSFVPVRASIDPHTPPGSYRASLQVGAHRYPVELHVTEHVQLDVQPAEIVVENQPGKRVTKTAVFTNAGNVPLVIGNLGPIALDDELIVCRTLRGTLRDADETVTLPQQWFNAWLRQGKKHFEEMGLLWVDVEGAPIELASGHSIAVELRVRVPDTLDPRTRYSAVGFLYDESIRFLIAPTGLEKATRRGK
ncbi:COG1470 family protein [Paraburkholderia caballeronis]|uniref:Uncharacterized protein n=1 Tax=Paraburkholderia caballeronis TaxID=416943 RepID=A0A1H7LAK3_9BURK|nr:hypothetical protein [Paraburkholderia caballeronis]PXW28357.1 hypothetical protein C7403_102249 [Paraburkholderia caballeronis]PXX03723.1 hypothetical protein C7407_102249 [Paraburkholderia caballeronis]RAK04467.1 hypothetical protein C7409_102249 [Paraburkholderia caballeronis]SED78988.1 hypothetical protein SAMN05445871_3926 [Paraburkholderia caballeronis]SEK95545.1 hypothetical protein SAMN05192542_104249 [Paraburkholderia caballeronis]